MSEKRVIWFNNWFTTIYYTIAEFKKLGYHIVASSSNPDQIYLTLADVKMHEPNSPSVDAYIKWALDVCKEHKVDYFFPKRMREEIASRADDFKSLGTTLVLDAIDILNKFNSKDAVYKELGYLGLNLEYKLATTPEELRTYIEEISKAFRSCCIKLDRDEGGSSFKVIRTEDTVSSDGISLNEAVDFYNELCRKRNKQLNMLVMPLLAGPEISADCLYTEYGLICIARSKLNHRVQVVNTPEDVHKYCESIQSHYKFKYPFNVQFRWLEEDLKLLEINPRISGGIQMTFPTGIIIPVLAIDKSIDVSAHREICEKTYRVSQLETPILLD